MERPARIRREREFGQHRPAVFIGDDIKMAHAVCSAHREIRLHRDRHVAGVLGDLRQFDLDLPRGGRDRTVAEQPLQGRLHRLIGERKTAAALRQDRAAEEPLGPTDQTAGERGEPKEVPARQSISTLRVPHGLSTRAAARNLIHAPGASNVSCYGRYNLTESWFVAPFENRTLLRLTMGGRRRSIAGGVQHGAAIQTGIFTIDP